jgi:hypothetical protein
MVETCEGGRVIFECLYRSPCIATGLGRKRVGEPRRATDELVINEDHCCCATEWGNVQIELSQEVLTPVTEVITACCVNWMGPHLLVTLIVNTLFRWAEAQVSVSGSPHVVSPWSHTLYSYLLLIG